jgi:hypothetical protein
MDASHAYQMVDVVPRALGVATGTRTHARAHTHTHTHTYTHAYIRQPNNLYDLKVVAKP